MFDLKKVAKVQEMKSFIQHGNITTYDHACHVAEMSKKINQRFFVEADEYILYEGAMLHDFFLYDWHNVPLRKWHGFTHAGRAARNAVRYCNVCPEVEHVIASHMWPLTPFAMPKTKEAWIVCLADKIVSTKETWSSFWSVRHG